jgi:flagellar biosynthesis protein
MTEIDKNKKVVALKYDKSKNPAPHVAAKGRGSIAARILEVAAENDIPIHTDADLVEILDKVELEQEVPLEVYAVVAEIFAYMYKMNNKLGESK